ncbi:hypothetical protein BB558_006638 [Smittium angustum]|uniref:AMP-dependent synthetase/ligase domain-containing protein n=1 Tax=Smittium angustum TaxID=133377 RepID=A0A2U1IX60_SMIAN|nr:hypothetical protein BB558_006638 [Smittium angustum]
MHSDKSQNERKPEWAISDRALSSQSLFCVGLHDTQGQSQIEYILNHSEASVVICSLDKVHKLLSMADQLPLLKIGKQSKIDHHPPKPSNNFVLLYTSGTTGNPKGVIGTHRNYTYSTISNVLSKSHLSKNQVFISHLTMAYCCEKDALGVSRILSRFYDTISAITINAPSVKGMISRKAVSEKIENLLAGKNYHHSIWDPLIFDKTKATLSNKIELIVTGSAPLEPKILNFLCISFQSLILESYGMTEVPISAIGTSPEDLESGIIGVPQVGVEVRLRDVPDMEYLTTDIPSPRGEILLRSIVGDGWYATGDIAKINPNGTISIIDRKESISKLSQGEYVSSQKIENVLSKHPLIM